MEYLEFRFYSGKNMVRYERLLGPVGLPNTMQAAVDVARVLNNDPDAPKITHVVGEYNEGWKAVARVGGGVR